MFGDSKIGAKGSAEKDKPKKDAAAINYTSNFKIEHNKNVPDQFVSLNKAAMNDIKKAVFEKPTEA